MTEKSPHSTNRKTAPTRRAPGWIAPTLAGVLAVAVTWGIGSTVFHNALVAHGLPEEVKDASADERALLVHGAELADLAARANKLAGLALGEESEALANLGTSLSQGAALLGELQFAQESAPAEPSAYSPEIVKSLLQDVATFSASTPALEKPSLESNELLSQIAFQTNLDANTALDALKEKSSPELALPLSASADNENTDPVSCLPSTDLLDPASKVTDPNELEAVAVARALDRGYALDFVLQLQAARGASSQAEGIEAQRTKLGKQLQNLRAVVDPQCGDLRQPAYALPDKGLENLNTVVTDAYSDFDEALVLAAGNAQGEARTKIATLAFDVLSDDSVANPNHRVLETGTSVNQ